MDPDFRENVTPVRMVIPRLALRVIAPTKPIIICETGSTEYGGDKGSWHEEFLNTLPSYAQVRALVWFNHVSDGVNWPIQIPPTAISGFARGLSNPAYVQPGGFTYPSKGTKVRPV